MEFLSYLINGISLGSIYAIIALGYTMVYGIAKMLNFAHGDVFMVAGLMGIYLTSSLGAYLSPTSTILVSLILVLALVDPGQAEYANNLSEMIVGLLTIISIGFAFYEFLRQGHQKESE